MKAVRIHEHGGPEVLRWEDITEPTCPPDRILIEIRATSINHLDLWVRKGRPRTPLPIILGSDGSGVISEVGKNTEGWQEGDPVIVQPGTYCGKCAFCMGGKENYCRNYGILGETADGTHCEFMVIDPRDLEKKPDSVSFEEAAAFPLVFLTAYTMLIRRARIQEGETVLVLGAGSGVGSAAIQIARSHGCRIIATAGSAEKLELARKLGAGDVIHHGEEKIHERVREFTSGLGVDVVVEHVGEATWKWSLKALAKGGRLVTCGATTGPRAEINLRHLFWKQQSILGSTMGDVSAFHEVIRWLREGKVKPVLDRTFPMSEVAEAHRYIEARKQFGKVVLVSDS